MNKPDTLVLPDPKSAGLPWQEVSLDVLREKYAKGAERELDGPEMARAVRLRVARALAEVEAEPARVGARVPQGARGRFHPRRADQLGGGRRRSATSR